MASLDLPSVMLMQIGYRYNEYMPCIKGDNFSIHYYVVSKLELCCIDYCFSKEGYYI